MESRVTALMPIKNGAVFLKKSLPQLQLSCKTTDEILIIDDFSDDNTAEIVKDAAKKKKTGESEDAFQSEPIMTKSPTKNY